MKNNKKSGLNSILLYCVLMTVTVFTLFISAEICSAHGDDYTVSVEKGYLALRTEMKYEESNEIGELYSGDHVEVIDYTSKDYWYVYSPRYDRNGYVNCDYLVESASTSNWMVSVDKGYLALRTEKKYDSSNEIGELYTGDMVQVLNSSDSDYWYVYSSKLDKSGYVNKEYLINTGKNRSATGSAYTVSVDKGYLALRTEKKYDSSNEIGELYTGDIVEVTDFSDPDYWYIYSPKHDKYGYVNCEYLFEASYSEWSVRVSKGYLALRTEKEYDSSNEIGELYTGDTVQVMDATDSDYWYVYSPKHDKYGYVDKDYLY